MEKWYKLFLMIDMSSYGYVDKFSGGCVKIRPVDFLKSNMAAATPTFMTKGYNFGSNGHRNIIFGSIPMFLYTRDSIDVILV